ncbi:hypothetical protein [Listeria goaensis]|uniref:hypothetical protein n=1 Tax=Listeria goaensis TaxID=1649188 RepID=UPI000B5957E2|nr:hypothetical protein [Listeria goaensis]
MKKKITYFAVILLFICSISIASLYTFLYFENDFYGWFLAVIILSDVVLLFLGLNIFINLAKGHRLFSGLIIMGIAILGIYFSMNTSILSNGMSSTGFWNIIDKQAKDDTYHIVIYNGDIDKNIEFETSKRNYQAVKVSSKEGYLMDFKYIELGDKLFSNLAHIDTTPAEYTLDEEID